MAEREQIKKPTPRRDTGPTTERAKTAGTSDELKNQIDDILDEIDEVLETNAEEFVKSYVQKGGQ